MPHSQDQCSRSLSRLRQLAREEAVAVRNEDVGALCRIAQLLPDATTAVQNDRPLLTSEANTILDEIKSAHKLAESFLRDRMADTAEELKRCAAGRKASSAYSGAFPLTRGLLRNVEG